MDRKLVEDVVRAMGCYVISTNGHMSICGLSPRDQDILDILAEEDLDELTLDSEIERRILDEGFSEKDLLPLLQESESWTMIDNSPTSDSEKELNCKAAMMIRDQLREHPGAVILGSGDSWSLWIKVGPDRQ